MHDDLAAGGIAAIGFGPGDPRLLTLEAMEYYRRATLLYTLKPAGSASSRCRRIAEAAGLDTGKMREIGYTPVSGGDPQRFEPVMEEICRLLDRGEIAAFATLGDPSLYSSWPSFRDAVRVHRPGAACRIIPGIPAFLEAAASTEMNLCQGEETFMLLPAPEEPEAVLPGLFEKLPGLALYKLKGRCRLLAGWLETRPDLGWSYQENGGTETAFTLLSPESEALGKREGRLATLIIRKINKEEMI